MSSPFTPELLAAWRRPQGLRRPVTLFEIYFADAPGGAATIYGCNKGEVAIEGVLYESGMRGRPIKDSIAPLGGGPSPCSATVRVENKKWAPLGGLTAFESLATWRWQGATLTIYLWELSLPDDASHKGLVFRGRIDQAPLGEGELILTAIQDKSWNKLVPDKTIDVVSEPNAPEGALGLTKPIIFGDWNDFPMRSPFTTQYGSKSKQQDAGAGRGVVPLMLVDPGAGAGKVKLVAAGHPCADLLDRAGGYSAYIVAGDVLAPIDTAGVTETVGSGSGDAYLQIDDDQLLAYFGLRAIDVRSGQNTATNPRRAMDPFDEQSFASLDQGVSQGVLELELPSGGSQGKIEAVQIEMAFIGNASNTHNIQVRPYNPTTAEAGSALSAVSTGTTPAFLSGTFDATWWTQNWDFGGISGTASPNRQTIDLRVDFTGGTTNKASVLWIIVKVKFRPQRSIVTPGTDPHWSMPSGIGGFPSRSRLLRYLRHVNELRNAPQLPPTFQVQSEFYGNVKGWKDDGSGTYTGTANSLIQFPPDVARKFLAYYCAATSFETAYDANDPTVGFGSFVKARHTLGRGYAGSAKIACWVGGRQVGAQTVLKKIGEQSLSCILFDRFAGKWMFHPWIHGAPVDYDYEFGLEDVPDIFDPETTSDVELLQGVRVEYGYDHFRGRTFFETFVGPESSSMGYSLPTWRDQKPITIDATNNKIDVKLFTTTYTATLASATYTSPHPLAADVETKLNALLVADASWKVRCWHGFNVTSGLNTLSLNYKNTAGGAYGGIATVTIPIKDYKTPDAVARAWAEALNAASIQATQGSGALVTLVFSVTYDHQTNKYTLSCNESVRIKIDEPLAGQIFEVSGGWLTLGWNALHASSERLGYYGSDSTVGTSIVGKSPMYADRYKILQYRSWERNAPTHYYALLWNTGPSVATNCAYELGWDKSADAVVPDASDVDHGLYSLYPRGMREIVATASRDAYGPKELWTFSADWVHDENTAILIRNTAFDFLCVPRVRLRLRTHMAPDLQRMRVVGFNASVDSKKPYPKWGSDGSWAGKGMRVLEVEQDIDDSYVVEARLEEA